jgi:hypothetical protein
MNKDILFSARGYYHQTIIRTAYSWLPLFAVVILVCSYFDKLRFILYLPVVMATYALIINQLKKKSVQIKFMGSKIQINDKVLPLSDIDDYYISQPLNELIMLRMNVKGENEALYIDKESQGFIEEFLNEAKVGVKKKSLRITTPNRSITTIFQIYIQKLFPYLHRGYLCSVINHYLQYI